MNWLHLRRKTALRLFLRAEINNGIVTFIRRFLAERVVYQSQFVREWWEDRHGVRDVPSAIIYNGVDLTVYTPDGPQARPEGTCRMLLVEGSLAGGQDVGLGNALRLAETLQDEHHFPMEVMVAGKLTPAQRSDWQGRARVPLTLLGVTPGGEIPALDRSAHVYFSAEPNPPCPNAVIEALACGLPVAGFATGALPELVVGEAGRLAPYGGDPWKLDPPDVPALARATREILQDQAHFRAAARRHAEEAFGLEKMVAAYVDVLLG
jgi:glycosyltransferase involved in cell wall biosynthesis